MRVLRCLAGVLWGLGCGADVEVSSPVARGRGACERNAYASQLVESPALPCVLLGRSKDPSPFHVSPSVLATGCFIHAITSLLLLKGSSVFVGAGSAAHPSDWLPAARPPTHDSD